jgi:Domain of unknown function (DUF4440)
MRTTSWLLVLIYAGLLPAQEKSEGSTIATILALEHAWYDAESRGDNRGLDRIFDNALVYVEYGKLVTKGEYLSRVRLTGSHPQLISGDTATVQIFGTTAIVIGTHREISAKDGSILKRWRYIDTWVNKNGSWTLVAAAASPLPK